jgi:hypothetical protein
MQHPEEGTIHAWLDGELSAEEARTLESHVAECRECAAKVAEARGLIAASTRIVSALDSIPGDVIPEPLSLPERSAATQPRTQHTTRRMWYSSAQFRAAAAVIFVAGASLVLARGRGGESVQRVMSTPSSSAPAEALENKAPEAPAPAATTPAATASQTTAPQPKAPKTKAPKIAVRATPPGTRETNLPSASSETSLRKEAAAVSGSVAAGSVDDSAPSRRIIATSDSVSARRSSSQQLSSQQLSSQLNEIVVTGVAEATAPVALRLLRADTVMGSIRTTFAVSPGVEVTLVESPVRNFSAKAASSAPTSARIPAATGNAARSTSADAVAAPAPPPARVINSISWMQKATGRMATLSGPFSREELEAIRQKLPAASR